MAVKLLGNLLGSFPYNGRLFDDKPGVDLSSTRSLTETLHQRELIESKMDLSDFGSLFAISDFALNQKLS